MSIHRKIVCPANSRKLSGRCIAGKEFSDTGVGEWIRPISARQTEEVLEYERQYADGSDPELLHIISVPLLRHHPRDYQTENRLLDPDRYWERHGQVAWTDLAKCLDPIAPLWNNERSSSQGQHDRIPATVANARPDSLRFLHLEERVLSVFASGQGLWQQQAAGAGNIFLLWRRVPSLGH